VSIIVFTDDPIYICENHEASSFDVNTINFPGGATKYEAVAAFTGGNTIMRKFCETMNQHFVYISDGHGDYPASQLEEMVRIKQTTISHGYTFNYASILIGGNLARSGMGKIN
jgi:hypothetical protein